MNIIFKKIRWQNFLSSGNQWTEMDLSVDGSTLIIGKNGAGKSTLLDAISFVLYGKPYRDINKPQLINSITNKNLLVEIEFRIENNNYKIVRGMKPGVFEIYKNEKLIDQNATTKEYQEHLEKNILKLRHKSFCQIVVIGSANFVPFMQLRPHERRKIIEDILDIEIFTKMFNILKDKISKNREKIAETRYKKDIIKQKIDLTKKHIKEIDEIKKTSQNEKKKKLKELIRYYEECDRECKIIEKEILSLEAQLSSITEVKDTITMISNEKYSKEKAVENIKKEISFFANNSTCPKCSQDIDEEFKLTFIKKSEDDVNNVTQKILSLQQTYDDNMKVLEDMIAVQKKISDLNKRMTEKTTAMSSSLSNMREIKEDLERVVTTDNENTKLLQYQKEFKEIEKTHEDEVDLRNTYEYAYSLLKDDGIKSKIINQYIPIINKLINKYLAMMDFFVQFELDPQFNESIKSRYRDEFTYNSFSEGEKMRIDLALLFTWRAVSRMRNSASSNILIMDEVFDDSLDTDGTEEFLKIIRELTKDTSIFIISHNGDVLYDKFDRIITFEKVKNFSKLVA